MAFDPSFYGESGGYPRYFSETAYKKMTENSKYAGNKELLIIDGACHTDLYDRMDIIPFEKLEDFFSRNLTEAE